MLRLTNISDNLLSRLDSINNVFYRLITAHACRYVKNCVFYHKIREFSKVEE